jgi:hypothetical protein
MYTQYLLTLGKIKYNDVAIVFFKIHEKKGIFFIPTKFQFVFLNKFLDPLEILEWRIFKRQINPGW